MDARLVRPVSGLMFAAAFIIAVQGQFSSGQSIMQVVPVQSGLGQAHAGANQAIYAQLASGRPGRGSRQQQAVANAENFIVFASDPQWAAQVAEVAEQLRRDLAVYWLGKELPAWPQRCPLHVQDAENLGAGGETRFALSRGVPGNWMMSVQGTRQRILDSVLPHEITHTIFATHFGRMNKYVPRWADEGACTTVENEAEKKKHRHFLQQFLKTGRGLAFNEMFRLKEYPQDILPLYAQGHSAVQFLLDQSGPRQFVQFIEVGMQTENWPGSLKKFYEYDSIGDFQISWNQWLKDGSPADLTAYAPLVRKQSASDVRLASGQASGPTSGAAAAQVVGAASGQASEQTAKPLSSLASAQNPPTSIPFDPSGSVEPNSGPNESSLGVTHASPMPNDLAALRSADSATDVESGTDSWYKRKLHHTSGSPATSIPAHNHFSGDPAHGLRAAPKASARPQNMQTPAIQVLDWGDAARMSGQPMNHSPSTMFR